MKAAATKTPMDSILADAYYARGSGAWVGEHFIEALPDLLEAVTRYDTLAAKRQIHDKAQRATSHQAIGDCYLNMGLHQEALASLTKAISLWKKSGNERPDNPRYRAQAYRSRAMLYLGQNKIEDARNDLDIAIR